jgi:hypothetical protein
MEITQGLWPQDLETNAGQDLCSLHSPGEHERAWRAWRAPSEELDI